MPEVGLSRSLANPMPSRDYAPRDTGNKLIPLRQFKDSALPKKSRPPGKAWAVYYWGEVRGEQRTCRRFFPDEQTAKAFCDEKRKEIAKVGQSDALILTDELKREAIDCQKKLARFLLNGRPITLGQAVDAFIRSESLASSSMTVAEAIARFIESKAKRGKSVAYVRQLKTQVGLFGKAFGGEPLATIKASRVEDWFEAYANDPKGKNAKITTLSPKSRKNLSNLLRVFFAWCIKKRYIDSNPAQGIETDTDKAGRTNRLLTPEHLRLVIGRTPIQLRPALLLMAFGGVRVEEATRLVWDDLNREGHLVIGGWKAKLGKRRVTPIVAVAPRVMAYLETLRPTDGSRYIFEADLFKRKDHQFKKADPALIDSGRARRFWSALRKVRDGLGSSVNWEGNGLRASAISYRLALSSDIKQTALDVGNSPETIQRDYLQLTTKTEAVKWFAIDPKAIPVREAFDWRAWEDDSEADTQEAYRPNPFASGDEEEADYSSSRQDPNNPED
jgi:integrase